MILCLFVLLLGGTATAGEPEPEGPGRLESEQTPEVELKLTVATMNPAKRHSNPSRLVDGQLSTFAQLADRGYMKVYLEHSAIISRVKIFSPAEHTRQNTIQGAVVIIGGSRDHSQTVCGTASDFEVVSLTGIKELFEIACSDGGAEGSYVEVKSASRYMKVASIQVYGTATDDDDSEKEYEDPEDYIPTDSPVPTEESEAYDDDDIIDNEPPPIITDPETGIDEWEPKIKKSIPANVIDNVGKLSNATQTPLGFLAFAGYVDYSLDVNSKDASPRNEEKTKQRRKFTAKDLETAATSFLRFNGFVEGGNIDNEMMAYMKKDRCGNHDKVYDEGREKCNELKVQDIAKEVRYSTQDLVKKTTAFMVPGRAKHDGVFPEVVSYYFESDVKFLDVRNGRSRTIFVGFNYDKIEANGKDTPLEVVALRFWKSKLCAQFVTLAQGQLLSNLASRETVLASCYTPTPNEEKTKAFKIRLDVYKPLAGILGKVYVTIRGEDVAQNVYKTSLLSSVAVMKRDDHTITTARLCQRKFISGNNNLARAARKKRFSISIHKWENADNLLRFNFQNYSTVLEQDGTRQEILKALNLYTTQAGFSFKEVPPTSTAELVFMFIRGRHADGQTFFGAGTEKAHAYSPVHSEIHFNDYEHFSINSGESKTSMFYVAAHEIGHALGLLHSEKRDALMTAGYPLDAAFSFTTLHSDDIGAVSTLYPGISGTGTVTEVDNIQVGTRYTPKSPFPTECHSQIDAAINIGDVYYIVSGPFVWQMRQKNSQDKAAGFETVDGYPKRVTDVFQQAYGSVDAIFKIKVGSNTIVFVLHSGNLISSYSFRQQGSMVRWGLNWAKKERSDFFSKTGNRVDKSIKAAFTYDSKTILVTSQSYYEITWAKQKPSTVTEKSSMTSLVGRALIPSDFTAAMTMDGETRHNLLVFRLRYVFVEQTFATNRRDKSIWMEVPNHFEIVGWCPTNNG